MIPTATGPRASTRRSTGRSQYREVDEINPAPREMKSGAKVICYSPIDSRHRPTGNCRHIVGDILQGPAAGVAIGQYEDEDCYYLFRCDTEWNEITDTWHETLEDAMRQAEFEYQGVSNTWQSHT